MKPLFARAFAPVLLLVTFGPGLLHAAEAPPPAPQFEESPLEPPPFRLKAPPVLAPGTLLPSESKGATVGTQSVAEAFYATENYPEAEKAALVLVAERTKSLGPEDKETLRARLLLAQILFKLDKDAESEAQLKKLLPIMTRVFGAEHRETLVCHSSLLKTVGSQGRDADAEEPFRSLIATETRVLGADDAETLKTRRYFARGLWDLGKTDEAMALYRQVLADSRRVLGPEAKETLQAWIGLVWITRAEGRHAEAEAQIQELLPLLTKVYGREHSDTLRCEADLVYSLSSQDKNTQVVELCRSFIPRAVRVLGPEDSDTLHTRRTFAVALTDLLKLPEAEKEYRQMLPAHVHKLGAEAQKTLWVRMLLAGIIYRQYHYAEAEAMLQEMLPAVTRVYGAEHSNTLACHSILLAIKACQGKNAEVEEPYRRLIATETRVNGLSKFETVRTRWRFAGVLFELGKLAEARHEFLETMDFHRSWLDFKESNTMAAASLKAMDLERQQNYAEAEATRRQLLARQTRLLGQESPDTLRSRAELALDMDAQDRHTEAEAELRDVLAFQERVLGLLNPDTLTTCHLLAGCLRGQGKTPESLTYAQRALDGRLKVLGKGDADTLTSQQLVHTITHPDSPPAPAPAPAPVPAAPKPASHDRPVATVNGTPILASELKRVLLAQQPPHDSSNAEPKTAKDSPAEKRLMALDTLIDQRLLVDEFKRQGGVIDPQRVLEDERFVIQDTFGGDRAAYLNLLAQQGLSLEQYRSGREQMLMFKEMRQRITGQVKITDIEQVQDYYEKNPQRWRYRQEVKLHTLTLLKTMRQTSSETRALAQRLLTQLRSGADFAELARQQSQDSHGEAGGAWDWTPVADLSEVVRATAEKTQMGAVSDLIEATGSFILLRVDDRRVNNHPSFEQVKDEVIQVFRQEKGEKQLKLKLQGLREAADIRMLDPGPV